ncbi:MAG: MFS transporter [Firmicutes bacterium]|nr:MFS transporter [Bacillota bacterium]
MMDKSKVSPLPLLNQVLYASGSFAFTLLERLIILYAVFYYLPPKELGLHNLVPERTYFGFVTVTGTALLLGRVFDALADPVVASLSDNNRSRIGRRKLFLLLSALPFALFTFLVFTPPQPGQEALVNGAWLAALMCLFYIAFTAYVNPFLALMSELGHTNSLRINLSTFMAFFGLMGMVLITIFFPQVVALFKAGGMETRLAYRLAIGGFSLLALLILYLVTFSFDERKHCLPARPSGAGTLESLAKTFAVRPFRIFLAGEMFLQFAMNVVTLGLMYYAVVIFRREESFMTVLAGIVIGVALLSFPFVNRMAKRIGKKKMIMSGMLILGIATAVIFPLSFNMEGAAFYIALGMIGLCGLPLAILTILINPTIADMARAEAIRSGESREAMFFGARAVPLKATIALTGVIFTYLLSTFGKDVAEPLGVQLSILAVSVASFIGFIVFSRYPEKEVQKWLE